MLSVPEGVKKVEVQIPVIDDKLIEDEETLYLEVGGKIAKATIADNELKDVEVERIIVRRDNAREFSNWDYKHQGLLRAHKDYVAFSIDLKQGVNKDSMLNFEQVFEHPGRDTNKKDFELGNSTFWVKNKQDSRFTLKGDQLTIPAGVKTFEARLPVVDDKIIEGTEYLTLKAGEKATAKVLDNDFVKLKSFKGADGAEIDVFNSDDPNLGENPYLLYTVRLLKPVRQAQKFNFTMDESSTATISDLDPEKKIKFDITKFNSNVPNSNKNSTISQKDDGTIWVPIGTKEFTAKLPILDDSIVEGREHLTLSIGSFNATAFIADNDFDDVNISSFHTNTSNGAERTKGYKRFLSYSLTFNERLNKQQTLSFSQVFPDDQTNANEDDVVLDRIKFKSDKPKKNKGFLLNNGQLVVPKGVSSFKAKVKIIDDKIVEGTEKLTLSVANLEATAAITDNDVAVASFQTASNGAEETIGFNDYLSYELTFEEKLKKRQSLTFSQSTPATKLMLMRMTSSWMNKAFGLNQVIPKKTKSLFLIMVY